MQQLTRDPEFESYLPTTTPEMDKELERQLVATSGPRDAIRVWKGQNIIVDGYRRHAICTRLNLPFRVEEIELKDRDHARTWMIRHQLARRNVTPAQQAKLMAALTEIYKAAKAARELPGKGKANVAARVAKDTGTTVRTVHRASKYVAALSVLPEDVRKQVETLQPAQVDVVALAAMQPDEQREILKEFTDGDYTSLGAVIRGEGCDEDEGFEDADDYEESEEASPVDLPAPRGDMMSPLAEPKRPPKKPAATWFEEIFKALGGLKSKIDALAEEYPGPHYRHVLVSLDRADETLSAWKHEEEL